LGIVAQLALGFSLTPVMAEEAGLQRLPAIHEDQVVFAYAGDLYTVAAVGIRSFGPEQGSGADPAGVVLLDPPVAVDDRAWFLAVTLIVHAMPRDGIDQPTLGAMEVGVLVPAG
jgi:hypothetical protein